MIPCFSFSGHSHILQVLNVRLDNRKFRNITVRGETDSYEVIKKKRTEPTVTSTVTSAITLSNVMRCHRCCNHTHTHIHTESPNPPKPSCSLETEAATVKQNNLFHYLSSQYGMDQTQQTTARLYGPVPHTACVNTRHLATGSHTAVNAP